MTENYLLGIDLGTTNVKGLILNESGTIIASASRSYPLILPGEGMAEQDADIWWNHTQEVISELTKAAGTEIVRRLRGIAVSSQTVTMLPVDKQGVPLRNAIIWMDGRSGEELQCIIDTIGLEQYIIIIGARPDTAFLPNKILWFAKHQPELFRKTDKILQASSYINYKLTGKMTMDMDQASRTQCLDINTLRWSDTIAKVIGADLEALFPEPQAVHEIIGSVTAEAAAKTGLISGIPVTAGASDAMASIYAMGLSEPGTAGESSGTSSLVFAGHQKPSAPHLPLVTKPCSIPGMPYIFDAPISTSGAAIKWYLDTMGKAEQDYAREHQQDIYTYLNELALEAKAGSNGLLFFPYLMGERAPLWNSHAKGMFIGLSLTTSRQELARSVFEGTAFALRHVIDTIRENGAAVDCLRITGGGAKSRTWSKIKASVLHVPVHILDEKASDVAFGDALLAGQATGVFPDLVKTGRQLIQVKEIIEPEPSWKGIYQQIYPFYLDMYRHLDEDLKNFQNIIKSDSF